MTEFLVGPFVTIAEDRRRLVLRLAAVAGAVHGRASRGWGPVVRWVAFVAFGLLVLHALINLVLDLVPGVAWHAVQAGDPALEPLWSVRNVLTVSAVILALRWIARSRERVVVEQFADHTGGDVKAVQGLPMLLIAEVSRLHELFGRVNGELSTPMSVGAQRRGGAGLDTDPGAFLSVSADEVAGMLSDAVATETTVAFAGIRIPIGFVLSLVGRIARGPRIVGSLHYAEATGTATLTAQIVGRGQARQWRVAAAGPLDQALLDALVEELACRMFNDLTLRGSVRWRAVRAFTGYLDLYWESYRTPRDRAGNLERAGAKLLEAVAEDEGFDLGYYNLGVVYSQLAETERAAAENSEYVKRSDRPRVAYEARLDAALTAFERAVALNRDRADAVYALAVHEFTRMGGGHPRELDTLDAIVCRCDRVLELDPCHAQAHDLKGMALMGLGRFDDSERSHRRAVVLSWRRLWRTEFDERAMPPSADSMLPAARANVASALRNLADVDLVRAAQGDRRERRLRARRPAVRAGVLAGHERRESRCAARAWPRARGRRRDRARPRAASAPRWRSTRRTRSTGRSWRAPTRPPASPRTPGVPRPRR